MKKYEYGVTERNGGITGDRSAAFANYIRDWPEPYGGIAFGIERACFGGREPLLYFEADNVFSYPDNNEENFIRRIYENQRQF